MTVQTQIRIHTVSKIKRIHNRFNMFLLRTVTNLGYTHCYKSWLRRHKRDPRPVTDTYQPGRGHAPCYPLSAYCRVNPVPLFILQSTGKWWVGGGGEAKNTEPYEKHVDRHSG